MDDLREQMKARLAVIDPDAAYLFNHTVAEWNKSLYNCNCGCHKDTLFTITHKGCPPMEIRLEDLPIELHGQNLEVNIRRHYPLWLIEDLIKNYTNYSI